MSNFAHTPLPGRYAAFSTGCVSSSARKNRKFRTTSVSLGATSRPRTANGTVNLAVAPNPGAARSATVAIAGQSATITVTITPSGSTGTVVRGTLYIDDFNNFTDGGDELAAFPYAYKIG